MSDIITKAREAAEIHEAAGDEDTAQLLHQLASALAKREATETCYKADATTAREFRLFALPKTGEWILSWALVDGSIVTRTEIKVSDDGLRCTIERLFEFVAASQQSVKGSSS